MGNEYDFAKVLDFGLVKVLSDPDEAHMTLPGATTGTPAYMAPELALGQAHIDGRTDLYGLGCVAYWLITGRLVFEEKNGTAMMLAHLNNAPVPPSKRSELEGWRGVYTSLRYRHVGNYRLDGKDATIRAAGLDVIDLAFTKSIPLGGSKSRH